MINDEHELFPEDEPDITPSYGPPLIDEIGAFMAMIIIGFFGLCLALGALSMIGKLADIALFYIDAVLNWIFL